MGSETRLYTAIVAMGLTAAAAACGARTRPGEETEIVRNDTDAAPDARVDAPPDVQDDSCVPSLLGGCEDAATPDGGISDVADEDWHNVPIV